VPFAGPAERLGAADIEALNRLYQLGVRSGFPAAVLEEGVYYGVRVRGHVVAAAGTHVVSSRERIAVVGNVMTQAEYRGHDFAKMVTSAVTAELLERVGDVTLNVHADNAPAIAAYSRVGYGVYCELVERIGRRRSGGWGLMRPIREAIRLTWPRDSR
jgi:predicted GNAT family acetyltransferase